MRGAFNPPRRKRSRCCAKTSTAGIPSDQSPLKKQKTLHQEEQPELPGLVNDNMEGGDVALPDNLDLDNLTSGGLAEVPPLQPLPLEENLQLLGDFLGDIPSDSELGNMLEMNTMSFCSSDTDLHEVGDECTSPPVDSPPGAYGEDPSLLVGLLDDKKLIDVGQLQWTDLPLPAEDVGFSQEQSPTGVPGQSALVLYPPGNETATSCWTPEQLCTVKQLAHTGNLEVAFQADGTLTLKPSPAPTPQSVDPFMTHPPPMTDQEFTEGPWHMSDHPESASSRASAVGSMIPTRLFCPEDFDEFFPPEGISGTANDCPAPEDELAWFVDTDWASLLRGSQEQTPVHEIELDPPVEPELQVEPELALPQPPKLPDEEVTDSEFLPICDGADQLFEDGTQLINSRPVTRISSTDFAKVPPYDLRVVAEDLAKYPLNPETNLDWCLVIPNRNNKELNRFLGEKTWTNGGKHKERPTPLNQAMDIQHHGFQAYKLPRGNVPSYLQLDENDRAMLRFSMRVYTRSGVTSSKKKAHPTAYIILTLKRPIRKLRHQRRT